MFMRLCVVLVASVLIWGCDVDSAAPADAGHADAMSAAFDASSDAPTREDASTTDVDASSDPPGDAASENVDDDDAGTYVPPPFHELCADVCERSKDEDLCGVLIDIRCGYAECGECPESQICAPLGSRNICVTCNEGPSAVYTGNATVTGKAAALALRGVREITGDLHVRENPELLGQLVCLERVGGSLTLSHPMWDPTDLQGLSRLREVGGDLTILGSIPHGDSQTDYYHLSSIDGLQSLTTIGGKLVLEGGEYTDVETFGSLTSIGGDLDLRNTRVESLGGLRTLEQMDGYLRILGGRLTTLKGLERLGGIRGLDVRGAYALLTLRGLQPLTELESVRLENLFSLLSLDGLRSLEHVAGAFIVTGTELYTLHGLSELTSVGGGFVFSYNHLLQSLDGLDALASVGGDISIDNAQSLESIAALHRLTEVGGDLILVNDPKLTSLTGLDEVTSVAGRLELHELGITDVNPLSKLAYVGGLRLSGLPEVSSLEPLANLTTLTGTLAIYDNAKLPLCEAQELSQSLSTACTCPSDAAPACACSDACTCSGNDNSVTECEP